jgi:hypothetical protein
MAKDQDKLEGQRAAVREHVEKFNSYPFAQDKKFALRTIRIAQKHIQDIKRNHSGWPDSWEDEWAPPGGIVPE